MYQSRKMELRTTLENVSSKISVTCDVWTSPNQKSFFGVKIHFIIDWTLQEKLICFRRLKDVHTGANLAKVLLEVFQEFGIEEKIFCVTCDNASNNSLMVKFVQQHYEEWFPEMIFSVEKNQIECAVHVVNSSSLERIQILR